MPRAETPPEFAERRVRELAARFEAMKVAEDEGMGSNPSGSIFLPGERERDDDMPGPTAWEVANDDEPQPEVDLRRMDELKTKWQTMRADKEKGKAILAGLGEAATPEEGLAALKAAGIVRELNSVCGWRAELWPKPKKVATIAPGWENGEPRPKLDGRSREAKAAKADQVDEAPAETPAVQPKRQPRQPAEALPVAASTPAAAPALPIGAPSKLGLELVASLIDKLAGCQIDVVCVSITPRSQP